MKVCTYSEAARRFASFPEQTRNEGAVRFSRPDGQTF